MDNGPEMVAWALRGLVSALRHHHDLHRARRPLGSPLHRVLQRSPP
jgi:hypothetical protein